MESLTGYVEHIIYRNADNGYTVLVLAAEGEEITCVGIFSGISEGETIEVFGGYTEHPAYGKQFKMERFEQKEPTDELSIERYLGSGAIKGIGTAWQRVSCAGSREIHFALWKKSRSVWQK